MTARIVLGAVLAAAAAPAAADSWLQAAKSETGFLFEGVSAAAKFSVDVPGRTIRTMEDNGRAFADIDGVLFQFMRLDASSPDAGTALSAHRDYETAYLRDAGAELRESALCGALDVVHREWKAVLPNGTSSVYLTFVASGSIVAIVAGAEPDKETLRDRKLEAMCDSLEAERAAPAADDTDT